jgi:hypothetical protein
MRPWLLVDVIECDHHLSSTKSRGASPAAKAARSEYLLAFQLGILSRSTCATQAATMLVSTVRIIGVQHKGLPWAVRRVKA